MATGTTDRTVSIECKNNFFRRNAAPRRAATGPMPTRRPATPATGGFERLARYANGYETGLRGGGMTLKPATGTNVLKVVDMVEKLRVAVGGPVAADRP